MRGYATVRSRADATRHAAARAEDRRVLRAALRPVPVPLARDRDRRGGDAGRPQPARPRLPAAAAAGAARCGRCPTTRRTSPTSPGFFVAHEVAHQWWGQATAPSSYRERWLSEGWAQYAAALWVRESLGEGAFRSMMDRMGRWAFEHDDAGPIHLGQRLGMLQGDPRIFRAVAYDKGAWVLHMLRGLLGDDAFFAGARAFLETHRFAKAGTEDLREALEKASGRDLRPYFERWIYGTGLPALTYAAHTQAADGGGFRTRVDVRADRLPGEIPLRGGARRLIRPRRKARRDRAADGGSFTFETKERPRRVAPERRPRPARTRRARQGSAVAVPATLLLERRDLRADLDELLLGLVQLGHRRRPAGAVHRRGVGERGLQAVDRGLVVRLVRARLADLVAPLLLRLGRGLGGGLLGVVGLLLARLGLALRGVGLRRRPRRAPLPSRRPAWTTPGRGPSRCRPWPAWGPPWSSSYSFSRAAASPRPWAEAIEARSTAAAASPAQVTTRIVPSVSFAGAIIAVLSPGR